MNDILATFLTAIISAVVGSFAGSLITIATFRSKLDANADSLKSFIRAEEARSRSFMDQRKEDRASDLREAEHLRREFRELCTNQNNARERELDFIRRQVEDFRTQIATSDRRQRFIMDLTTAIARKQGITHRITDAIEMGVENDG